MESASIMALGSPPCPPAWLFSTSLPPCFSLMLFLELSLHEGLVGTHILGVLIAFKLGFGDTASPGAAEGRFSSRP